MFRKLALIVGAVVALGGGVAATSAPASAQPAARIVVAPAENLVNVQYYGERYYPRHRDRYYDDRRYRDRRYRDYGPPRFRGPPPRHCERVVVRKRVYGEWRRVVERRCYPRRYY
ncbi:hypothetical protein [Terrihabitans sp. B22-R8]|uniref:hypothetical protein n=1 Tax=Terrihabitans sp. B22-R8 TaxID=3425128 RepID=UPI00403D168A